MNEEHICVYCGAEAHYQTKGGKWICMPHWTQCPANRNLFKNKKKRDYKAQWNNLPDETKQKMLSGISSKKSHEKAGKTLKTKILSGEIVPSWRGRKHTPEQIEKIRISTVKYFEEIKKTGGAKVSKTACAFIDKLNESKGWHLQHGMNGGEIIVGGYYLDGYDIELNIAFEYDEPTHYLDVQNNILKERDISRMKYIHNKLNCRFFRYNERKDYLYEVDFSII